MNATRACFASLLALPMVASAVSLDVIVADYERYTRLTPRAVPLNVAFAEACVLHRSRPALGPHDDTWMSVFMNAAAADHFRMAVAGPFPEGSVVVKRKEGRRGKVEALGGMVKRAPGFDPSTGDWEFFYAEAGEAAMADRDGQCGDCHSRAQDSDFVFGDWAHHPTPR